MKKLQVTIGDDLYDEFKKAADRDNRSLSSYVRMLIEGKLTMPMLGPGIVSKSNISANKEKPKKEEASPKVELPKKIIKTTEDLKNWKPDPRLSKEYQTKKKRL